MAVVPKLIEQKNLGTLAAPMLSNCHHQFDKHAWPSHRTLSVNQSGYLRRHWSFGSVLFGKGTLAAPEVNMESVRTNVVSFCIVMAALFRSASSRHDQVSALKPDSNTTKDKKLIHSTWTNVRYVSTVKSLHNNVFDNFYCNGFLLEQNRYKQARQHDVGPLDTGAVGPTGF